MAVKKPVVHIGRDAGKINFRVTKSSQVVKYKVPKANNKVKSFPEVDNANLQPRNESTIGDSPNQPDGSGAVEVTCPRTDLSPCAWSESLPKLNNLNIRGRKDSVLDDSPTRSEGFSPLQSSFQEVAWVPSPSTESLDIVTKQNAMESPLLRLPLEIRQKIYAHIFSIREYRVQVPKTKPVCIPNEENGKTHRELLGVCKQIHSEAALLPIKLNVFYVLPHLVLRWLQTEKFTVPQEDSISMLRVNFPEVQYGAHFLSYFWGLRKLYVSWTPDNRSKQELETITRRLRVAAGKEKLEVLFLHCD